MINTQWDVAPSDFLGQNGIGSAADYGLNFMSSGILARGGKNLDDHTLASGMASSAQIGWKAAGFLSGLSKKVLVAMIASGWSFEQAVHYLRAEQETAP